MRAKFIPAFDRLSTRSVPSDVLPAPMVPFGDVVPVEIDPDLIAIDIEVEMFPPDPFTPNPGPVGPFDGGDDLGGFQLLLSEPIGGFLD